MASHYDTLKWGPTSANISPARFLFIRSTAAKERLRPSLAPGNVEKTMAAPVTVIIAYDRRAMRKLGCPEVLFEEISIDFLQARFWITSGLPTTHQLNLQIT